ncbi:uncharacterized protein LOC127752344 [Frankliniella occidentalis]|uniref:Uncharacterized protein LOC127752344 n=1 Tax=Frankliniella occidentalis TaxID=133901 RepID=A0A9C6XW96_FRAOC|nr:uncharacterized protein LOC127752344 [Frankliniella occidentalis]
MSLASRTRPVAVLAVAVLALVDGGAPAAVEQQGKVGSALLASCPRERGLASPCAVPCTVSGMSGRLCRACCVALGLDGAPTPASAAPTASGRPSSSTTSSPAGGDNGPTQAPDVLEFFAIRNATQCLAPCVNYTAKEIRNAFENPKADPDTLTKMASQLSLSNPGQDWKKILESAASGRYASIVTLCERGMLIC